MHAIFSKQFHGLLISCQFALETRLLIRLQGTTYNMAVVHFVMNRKLQVEHFNIVITFYRQIKRFFYIGKLAFLRKKLLC